MDRLVAVVSAWPCLIRKRAISREASIRVATRLTARFPTIVAADRAEITSDHPG